MLDIHALRVFYLAAEVGSFTAAAHKLNMTQPAVSMQVRALEEHLQVKLFERSGRAIHLTKAGQALLPRAREIVEMVITTEEFIRMSNDEVLGDLLIGCSLPSTSSVFIQLAARFQAFYPLVRVRIPAMSKSELTEKIISGQMDYGIMSVVNHCAPLECLPLFKDQIVLIAAIDHPFSQRTSIRPQDLTGQHFVCQGEDSACRQAVRDTLRPFGVEVERFDIRMEIGNHSAIITAVECGVGLSFVSRLDAQSALARGTIQIVPVEGVQLSAAVGLAYSNAQAASLVALKFRTFLNHERTRQEIHQLTQKAYARGIQDDG